MQRYIDMGSKRSTTINIQGRYLMKHWNGNNNRHFNQIQKIIYTLLHFLYILKKITSGNFCLKYILHYV